MVQFDQVLQQYVAPGASAVRPGGRLFCARGGGAACSPAFAPSATGERVLTFAGAASDSAAVSLVLYVCDVTQQHQLWIRSSPTSVAGAHMSCAPHDQHFRLHRTGY